MNTHYSIKFYPDGITVQTFNPQNNNVLASGYDVLWTKNQFDAYVAQTQPIPQSSPDLEVARDRAFGNRLINEFLTDNRDDPNVTTANSSPLLMAFSYVKVLADLGDIHGTYYLLQQIPVDAIFTQARKDKYIQMIIDHFNGL